jgi:hypothetical protein
VTAHIQSLTTPVFALLTGALTGVSLISPVAVRPAAAGHFCDIHDAPTVLERHVASHGGGLDFVDRAGRHWNLVLSTDDPIIAHQGSGTFHPAPEADVTAALDAVAYPGLSALGIDVFLLPYPRRESLASSAADGAIYLSPGVYPYAREPLHALVVHELGHVVHQRLLPDWDTAGWAKYRELRGLTDETIYHSRAAHRNRPREIFAEDFRALFGGAAANYSGSIENTDLRHPSEVPGLAEFFLGLIQSASAPAPVAVAAPVASPNPFVAATTLSLADGAFAADAIIDIVDVAGRLVRRLEAASDGADGKVGWNATDASGRRVPAGVYFAIVPGGPTRLVTRLVVAR